MHAPLATIAMHRGSIGSRNRSHRRRLSQHSAGHEDRDAFAGEAPRWADDPASYPEREFMAESIELGGVGRTETGLALALRVRHLAHLASYCAPSRSDRYRML